MEEPLYAEMQREVQRKLGRCLIRIQQYELLLKEMVAKREVSAILGQGHGHGPVPLAEFAPDLGTKTMGQLVGELTGKYFQPTLQESGQTHTDTPADEEEHPVGWARVSMSVSMAPDTHAQLTVELQELVDLRNDLVHHFVEGQNLVTEEGCIAADMYLQDCYSEIDRHLASLQGWAASMNEAKRSMAAFITSPEYKEFLLAELSPSVSEREAALPRLVELLRRAEGEHASDGWTALSEAIAFIRKVEPDATPRKHTFGSWRQVLHDSSTFEVRRTALKTDGRMETWFRTRA